MNPTDPRIIIRKQFMGFLDPKKYHRARGIHSPFVPSTHAEVRLCFRDFLHELRCYIEGYLEDATESIPWRDANVEFLFSVWDTWSADVTKDFESLAREAGVGSTRKRHAVIIGPTSTEAMVLSIFETNLVSCVERDVVLIVSMGEKDTLLDLWKAHILPNRQLKLECLHQGESTVGYSSIDTPFIDSTSKRLKSVKQQLSLPLDDVAQKMTMGPFKEYRSEYTGSSPHIAVPVPGLPNSFDSEVARIMRGRMLFTINDLHAIFETQIQTLCRDIDDQMSQMAKVAPQDRIKYIILRCAPRLTRYLSDQLKQKYVSNVKPNMYARDVKILSSLDPNLDAVKGLALHRMQQLQDWPQNPLEDTK